MKAQQKLDKVLEIAKESVQEEVGALMGVNFKLTNFFNQIISKDDYFSELTGKKIVAKIDVTGEIEGYGGLVIDLKDGIRLGGTLIMLPHSELDDVVKNETYTEETEDSYGEIANIIAGAFTKVFEDNFPKSCRFVRKEQVVVSPLKVEIESEEPVLDQWYYLVRAQMKMDGTEMGELDFLLPAAAFGLETPVREEASDDGKPLEEPAAAKSTTAPEDVTIEEETEEASLETEQEEGGAVEEVEGQSADKLSAEETAKHKKMIDKLLDICRATVSSEVGALLGVDVKLGKPDNRVVDKEEFFLEEASGKQVLAHMDVVDEDEGVSYLFVSLKDAIRIGSILIMLPPSELETAVSEEDFSPDAEDAYGEIANIISGSYTSVFQEQYTQSIRFIKKELETVSPMKVDTESDDVIPKQHYYMNSCQIEIDGKSFGQMNMLLPLDLFNLSQLVAAEEQKKASLEDSSKSDNVQAAVGYDSETDADASSAGGAVRAVKSVEDYEVLIIENSSDDANVIKEELANAGLTAKSISFNDNIKYFITDHLKLVFIVMKDVDEQSYSVTIKVNTLSPVPIVAAGSEWTRSKVIKAVKYGVHDILLTPASSHDIKEKVDNNILKMAA